MGNCDHQQFQFSVENIENFSDFEETIDKSNDFEETIENFNGFEETIENVQWFWRTPSPLNVFWYSDHCQRWFFNGFWVAQPLVSMVFDGEGPLIKRWNGFNESNRSNSSHGITPNPNPSDASSCLEKTACTALPDVATPCGIASWVGNVM